jgi:uncharacterized protein (TIGR04222 family)
VQSTPPDGVLPGELGTLLDEVADPRDVTATIVDLAVRGYLSINEVPPKKAGTRDGDWRLVAVDRDRGDLAAFERTLLGELFKKRAAVRMSAVKTTFASSMAAVQQQLYERVTEKGWFTANPRTVRNRWYAAGTALLLLGVVVGVFAGVTLAEGSALVALAFGLVGILVLVLAHAAPARSAAGTQVLAEAVAFKRYLETADPTKLRIVHGEDLFSRYLPYAIAFGVTERWAATFGAMAQRGQDVPQPTWYRGSGAPYAFWSTGGASRLESFAEATTTSISAATPASSGGSGSGGRGYSGGGVGGGGGGGW